MSHYPVSLEKVKDKAARKTEGILRLPLGGHSNVKEISNSFGETITRIDGDIPVDLKIEKDRRFLFISYGRSKYTHALHKYPAKLNPELTAWLIKRYSKPGDIILDPFAGSGTTNLEALLNKRHSVGIDNDPLARFLSRVKTTPLDENEVSNSLEKLLRKITYYIPELVCDEDIPIFPYRDKWYQKEIILELSYFRKIISRIWASKEVIDFYKICFSSVLRTVSNYDDSISGTAVRKSSKKKIYPSLALSKFAEALLINTLRIMDFSNVCPKKIITEFPNDSSAKNIKYPDRYFNLAITSIPDINSFYSCSPNLPEIYWLGLANNPFAPSRMTHEGRETARKYKHGKIRYGNAKEGELKLGRIFGVDIRAAYLTYKYSEEMKSSMEEVYRTLETGGKYVIAAGNSRIGGEVIESWKYLINIAKQVGFKLNTTFISENIRDFMKTPASGRINSDRIIVLEK
jgi:DNA modification methylase